MSSLLLEFLKHKTYGHVCQGVVEIILALGKLQ